jgi:hypothetical protein
MVCRIKQNDISYVLLPVGIQLLLSFLFAICCTEPPKMTGPDIHTHWDISFEWTELHRTAEQLHPMTFSYDKLADDCLVKLNELSPPEKYRPKAGEPATKAPKRDLLALLEKHAKDDAKLQELWTEINTVPDWVDWDQIKRGQEVFFRYGMPILNVVSAVSIIRYPSG